MRTDHLLLEDILDAAREVVETTPPSQDLFDANKFVRSHVLRHIQIIGEAAWRISAAMQSQHPEVRWKLMAGMRHVLVHDYFDVNWIRVYETARDHVPELRSQIRTILDSLSQGGGGPAEAPRMLD